MKGKNSKKKKKSIFRQRPSVSIDDFPEENDEEELFLKEIDLAIDIDTWQRTMFKKAMMNCKKRRIDYIV